MKRNVKLPDAGDEVSYFFELFLFMSAIKLVIILILSLSSLIDHPFYWRLCIHQIFHCPETYLQVLFLSTWKVVYFFQIDFLNKIYRQNLLQFWLEIWLDFFLWSRFDSYVEVRLVGKKTLDELSFLALEEAKNSHPVLVVMESIFERTCFEVGEESEELFLSFIEL